MSKKTRKYGDPRKRSVNRSKPVINMTSEEKQKRILRLMIKMEPRNIPFYKTISSNWEKWIYPDLGMMFDCKVIQSVLSEMRV
jgi:hypothetical protein